MRRTKIFVLIFLAGTALALPLITSAQNPPVTSLTIQDIVVILKRFVSWIFTVLIIVAVVFIVLAGFKYLTGQGDPSAVAEASRALVYAAIAIAVALLSVGMITLVGQLVGATGGGWNPFN